MLTWSSLPNFLSVMRILMVIPCVWWLGHHQDAATLVVFVAAAVTDAADGGLAKRFGWTSRLGSLLDPIAVKILLGGMIVTLGIQGRVPLWWAVGVVMRDVIIVSGALAYRYWVGYLEGRPSVVSKINTFLQVVSVMCLIAPSVFNDVLDPRIIDVVLAMTFLTTVVSGLDYVLSTLKRARQQRPIGLVR